MMNKEVDFYTLQTLTEDRTISTAKAAKMLGMSTSVLQKMVDEEIFKAWKTPGGHRRIEMESVLNYQESLRIGHTAKDKIKPLPIIKIIIDDQDLLKIIEKETVAWAKKFDISFWDSVQYAFLSFSEKMPDVLIVQLSRPLNLQISTIIALDKFLKQSEKVFSVLVLSQYFEFDAEMKMDVGDYIKIHNVSMNSEFLNVFMLGAYAMSLSNSMNSAPH